MPIKYEQENTQNVILGAVNKMVDFVSPTFGPAGNKCIIDKQLWRKVVDDGVAIARDYELTDEFENAVVKVVRETAIKTNDRVGDGTTGALIMLQAIMNETRGKDLTSGKVRRELAIELKSAAEEAKEQLSAMAKTITGLDDLKRAAYVSYDNKEVADMIADAVHYVGKEGVLTVDNSNTLQTTFEKSRGIEIPSGYISPYMINNPAHAIADMKDVRIILTSYRITNFNDYHAIVTKLMNSGIKECLFIAEGVESDALATLITNRMKGTFFGAAVALPRQGVDQGEYVRDLALLTGGNVFSAEIGNRLDNAEIQDLGRAERVIVRDNKCTIVGGKGNKAAIEKEKMSIRSLIDQNPKDAVKKKLQHRLARLANGIGVIRVGAPTENETKSMKEKVDDAVNATFAAYRGGIVAGSGLALASINTSSDILNKALKAPHRKFNENMGIEDMPLKAGEAYNPVTGKKGHYLKVGVIDPVDVLIAQIDSSVSIATQLRTSYGILVEEKESDAKM